MYQLSTGKKVIEFFLVYCFKNTCWLHWFVSELGKILSKWINRMASKTIFGGTLKLWIIVWNWLTKQNWCNLICILTKSKEKSPNPKFQDMEGFHYCMKMVKNILNQKDYLLWTSQQKNSIVKKFGDIGSPNGCSSSSRVLK